MARRTTASRHDGEVSIIKYDGAKVTERRFRPGVVGLVLSVISLIGLFLCGVLTVYAVPLMVLSVPGTVFGILGRFRGERWPGFLAMLIGIFVALFLPTMYVSFVIAYR